MAITYTEAIFLYNLQQINAERSIYSLYHLFQGKKSSQTIQDAHLFKITAFFQVFPSITRTEIEKEIELLGNKDLIQEVSKEHFRLTVEGKNLLEEFCASSQFPPKFLEGWKYHHLTTIFWERLSLLIQVCSNLIHKNKGFIPIQNKVETQEWVKLYLKKLNMDRNELARTLYDELVNCFEQHEQIIPSVFVLRLTGHNKIGLTPKQAAALMQMEYLQYELEFLNALHFILESLSRNRRFPCLSGIVRAEDKIVPFTLSTEKTYELLQKGYSPEEIAQIRHLKTNTIEDHVVEIALHLQEFDIEPYVHPDKEARILKVVKEMSTKRLRDIREHVADVNYFEIRLVLARNGEG